MVGNRAIYSRNQWKLDGGIRAAGHGPEHRPEQKGGALGRIEGESTGFRDMDKSAGLSQTLLQSLTGITLAE